jgi:hypothetical protein
LEFVPIATITFPVVLEAHPLTPSIPVVIEFHTFPSYDFNACEPLLLVSLNSSQMPLVYNRPDMVEFAGNELPAANVPCVQLIPLVDHIAGQEELDACCMPHTHRLFAYNIVAVLVAAKGAVATVQLPNVSPK